MPDGGERGVKPARKARDRDGTVNGWWCSVESVQGNNSLARRLEEAVPIGPIDGQVGSEGGATKKAGRNGERGRGSTEPPRSDRQVGEAVVGLEGPSRACFKLGEGGGSGGEGKQQRMDHRPDQNLDHQRGPEGEGTGPAGRSDLNWPSPSVALPRSITQPPPFSCRPTSCQQPATSSSNHHTSPLSAPRTVTRRHGAPSSLAQPGIGLLHPSPASPQVVSSILLLNPNCTHAKSHLDSRSRRDDPAWRGLLMLQMLAAGRYLAPSHDGPLLPAALAPLHEHTGVGQVIQVHTHLVYVGGRRPRWIRLLSTHG